MIGPHLESWRILNCAENSIVISGWVWEQFDDDFNVDVGLDRALGKMFKVHST